MAKKKATSAPGGGTALAEDTQRLHQFFHGLYQDPEKADQFNESPKARQKLVDGSDLSAAHKKLIKRGCIPDVIHALVGAPALSADMNMVVECCQPSIACDHPECHALKSAAAQRPAKTSLGAAAAKTRPATSRSPKQK